MWWFVGSFNGRNMYFLTSALTKVFLKYWCQTSVIECFPQTRQNILKLDSSIYFREKSIKKTLVSLTGIFL